MKISIVVAVYNKGRFIKNCLNSLLRQTYSNFEIVLVNDGSIDDSSIICEEFASKDGRIKYFTKLNSGVSSTRQFAVNMSTGDFVIHVDPDDYVEINFLQLLVDAQLRTNADLVFCDYFTVSNKAKVHQKVFIENEPIRELINGKLHAGLWNKLIRKKKLAPVVFNNKLVVGEDLDYLVKLFLYFPQLTIAYVSKPLYNYVVYSNSLSNQVSENKIRQKIELYNCIESNLGIRKSEFEAELLERKLNIRRDILLSKGAANQLINYFSEADKLMFKSKLLPLSVKIRMKVNSILSRIKKEKKLF